MNRLSPTVQLAGDATSDAWERWGPRTLNGLVAGMVLARLWLVFYRLYDPDELAHLHAGFCIWQGMVPYRDFFEQHGPVLWYLSLPWFAIWGGSLKVLFAGRLIVWLLGAGTLALTWHIGRRLYGPWGGAIASFLLVTLAPFQEKNVEWRPDNVAVPLVLLASLAFGRVHGRHGALWAALAGAALALGFFCTQKIAYVAGGMICAFVWRAAHDMRLRGWTYALALAGGGCLVAGLVFLFYAGQGALTSYLYMTVLLPLKWKTHEPVLPYLVASLASAPIFWGSAAAGWSLSLCDVGRLEPQRTVASVVAGGAAAHTAGLLFVPAAFHQYYLPLSPLAALLAARAMVELPGRLGDVERPTNLLRAKRVAALVLGLAVTAAALWVRVQFTSLDLAWKVAPVPGVAIAALAGCAGAWRVAAPVLIAVAAIAAVPYLEVQFRWSHEAQTRQIERLMRATGTEDRFFDGYTGYGALRPHAFFYYWINQHSWPMVPDRDKLSGSIAALADPHTRVVLYDGYLARYLPTDVQRYLERHFVPDERYSSPNCLVFVKHGHALPSEPN